MNRTRTRNHKQGGFTLIELVIVITIISSLAAVALPRFVALQRDARIAKLKAARGAAGAAIALIHGAYLTRQKIADTIGCAGSTDMADNSATGTSGTLCTENGLIAISSGYPASTALGATPPGIVEAAGLVAAHNPSSDVLEAEGYLVIPSPGVGTVFQISDAPTPASCAFTYTDSASGSTSAGSTRPPRISAFTTTGC